MSAKNVDHHDRWRNKTVAFRVSPEEDAQIETAVRLTGLTKQDYIIQRLLNWDVVMQGNPKVYKALRSELAAVLDELRRIETGTQPIQKTTDYSITEDLTENNSLERAYKEKLRQMRQINDPAYLHTISMRELYENVYQSKPLVIDGLLYAGTYLFAGAPKVGKSFLVAQIAYHVSTGTALWNYLVHKGKVLYLALEDDYQRLQRRLYRMFETADTENLRLAVYAKEVCKNKFTKLSKSGRMVIRRCDHGRTNSYYATIAR